MRWGDYAPDYVFAQEEEAIWVSQCLPRLPYGLRKNGYKIGYNFFNYVHAFSGYIYIYISTRISTYINTYIKNIYKSILAPQEE